MMDRSQAEYLADTYADLILRLSYTYLKTHMMHKISVKPSLFVC